MKNLLMIFGLSIFFLSAVAQNTAYPSTALPSNTGGSNSAFGAYSLYQNQTGYYNVAVGTSALYSNISGSQNCAIGENSLSSFTTGLQNTAVGRNSMQYSASASFNTAVGYFSLSRTTGQYNLGLGWYVAPDLLSGASNVLIGKECGINLVNGSNNIFMGRVSLPASAATATHAGTDTSNTIILADGAGNQRLYINSNGNTGIGLPSNSIPTNKLELNGGLNGTAGLRFRNFTNTNYNTIAPTSNRRVLSVNNVGDVILVDDVVGTGNSGSISNNCSSTNFITKSLDVNGNLTCSSIYDDGLGHVGFGFGSIPNSAVNVSINGSSATYGGSYNVSDRKFKKDIREILEPLNLIKSLSGKTYNWRKDEFKTINFTSELQFGLIAQDLQKVIPSLVLESENGDLAINYVGLIPVLIEAIKEQQMQIELLRNQISDNFQNQNGDLISLMNTKIISVSPNPSNDVVNVSLNIEQSVITAELLVHELNGNVLSRLLIRERANNISRILQRENFGKGIYIVSLIVNGKNIDTKKIAFN